MNDSRINIAGDTDLLEGTYRDEDVYVLSLNSVVEDEKKVKDVPIWSWLRRVCSSISLDAADIRRSDLFAEKTQSPEHSPFHWCNNGSFPNGCGADVG